MYTIEYFSLRNFFVRFCSAFFFKYIYNTRFLLYQSSLGIYTYSSRKTFLYQFFSLFLCLDETLSIITIIFFQYFHLSQFFSLLFYTVTAVMLGLSIEQLQYWLEIMLYKVFVRFELISLLPTGYKQFSYKKPLGGRSQDLTVKMHPMC